MSALAQPEYARLLSKMLPAVIHTKKQYAHSLQQIEALLEKEDDLTVAEKELLDLLTLLIERFEDEHFELPKASPLAALKLLMEEHGLRQKDLVDVFGTPSIVSEVLHGKRELSKEHIRRLSERFDVSPELFF